MKAYLVGGAVRDTLLFRQVKDRDYVVVGSTPESMEAIGFHNVGADFPVFLHPETGDEYALARTEKKTGKGYNGFTTDHSDTVTLEADLLRRDLTVNAMAMVDDLVVDPFDGQQDLEDKVLRHVDDEGFVEDPVRVLRLARFQARFGPSWSVASETKDLVKKMVSSGLLGELTKERVWKELERSLMENHPRMFFDLLLETGALEVVLPELFDLKSATENVKWHPEGDAYEHTMLVLTQSAQHLGDLMDRLAALLHDLGKGATPKDELPKHYGHDVKGSYMVKDFCEKYCVATQYKKTLVLLTRYHMNMHRLDVLNPKTFVKMFDAFGVVHGTSGVNYLFRLGVNDARGRLGSEDADVVEYCYMVNELAHAYKSVKTLDVADPVKDSPQKIKQQLFSSRVKVVAAKKKDYLQQMASSSA